jgi:hypothetical protein
MCLPKICADFNNQPLINNQSAGFGRDFSFIMSYRLTVSTGHIFALLNGQNFNLLWSNLCQYRREKPIKPTSFRIFI